MALFDGFAEPETETAFVRSERAAHRSTLRALQMLLGLFGIASTILLPPFLPPGSVVYYNLLMLGLVIQMASGWYIVGSDYYLRWRWLDCTAFVVSVAGNFWLMRQFAMIPDLAPIGFIGMTMVSLASYLVVGAVFFVANVRWFVASAMVLSAWYIAAAVGWTIPTVSRVYVLAEAVFFTIFALYLNHRLDARARSRFAAAAALDHERARNEELLYNVLPPSVARRLRNGEAVADSFSDVTVIFADVVGFSSLSKSLSPGHLVKLLNTFFSFADALADRLGIEKVKTIGDAYLAVSGGVGSATTAACQAVAFARGLISAVAALAEESGVDIRLRVGLHTGPVVGGVVGSSRLAYDYWGDTMNIASRIEGAATPGGIAISASTYYACGKLGDFGPPETVLLKGVGETTIHRLLA